MDQKAFQILFVGNFIVILFSDIFFLVDFLLKRKENLISHADIEHSQIHSYIMKLIDVSQITEDEDLKNIRYEANRAADLLRQVGIALKKNRETVAEISSWSREESDGSVKI